MTGLLNLFIYTTVVISFILAWQYFIFIVFFTSGPD